MGHRIHEIAGRRQESITGASWRLGCNLTWTGYSGR